VYRLATPVTDPACPVSQLIRLYRDRWEIETAYLEIKSTIPGVRVLRARTPAGLDQEIYALLVTYQALRIAITDTTVDLVGTIGRHAQPVPTRQPPASSNAISNP
jgi:hypothetical protein